MHTLDTYESQLSLKVNRFKCKILGKFPITLEEYMELILLNKEELWGEMNM